MMTVALDLLGGDGGPARVADAVRLLAADAGDINLLLVGPPQEAAALLAERGIDREWCRVLPSRRGVPMQDHPLDAVRDDAQREHPELSVIVAARAVRDGLADAWVSVGHTGAAVAASVLTCGRIPGMTRAAIAVVLPALAQPVVLLDAGATMDASPEALAQFALAGWCYAQSLGIDRPIVGLLTIGSEPGKGDDLRREAECLLAQRLAESGIDYAGPVEGHDVVAGRRAQVVVTDGFTGNVLLKGIEGAVAWSAERMGRAYRNPIPARRVMREVATGEFAGGMLLGVNGVTVVGHGAGRAPEIAACIRLAARAAGSGVVSRVQGTFAGMAGLT